MSEFTVTLPICASDTVRSVKAKIEELENVKSASQRLVFNGEELVDDRELSEYGIRNGDTIQLNMLDFQLTMVCDRSVDAILDVNPGDLVVSVKQKMEAGLGVPVDQQRLLSLNGMEFKDDRTLFSCNIHNQQKIEMRAVQWETFACAC
ncbi:Polyubiquitin (Fragment) [Seminavis robusta]|uniref:Polyubiquitin n=1 Tax=Seminavis robusta TaxID=568900 RepID=A0A9N8DAR2_9STRA